MNPKHLRVAIYARFSSELQNNASINDPVRICRERAAREGWQIIAMHEDAGVSGYSMILRPGVQRLLKDRRDGRFDIVLSEALDLRGANARKSLTATDQRSLRRVHLILHVEFVRLLTHC